MAIQFQKGMVSMAIFVSMLRGDLRVTGDTFLLNKLLGAQGLGFKFNKDKKVWKGASSLNALLLLQEQTGAILSEDALLEMEAFQIAARKRAAYVRCCRERGLIIESLKR